MKDSKLKSKIIITFLLLIPIFLLIFFAYLLLKDHPKVTLKTQDLKQEVYKVKEDYLPQPTTLLPSGLPDKHQIKTTFVPQAPEKNWDQPWQDACEEAGILTLHYYYQQINPDLSQMLADYQKIFDYQQSQGWSHDINTSQMLQTAQEVFDYQGQILENPSLEELKSYLAQDIPIIVPANGKTLYQENKHFKNGGPYYHNLVLLGYDDSLQKFIVHDVGTQFGAYFRYSYSLLMDSIHDLPDSKDKKDIQKGAKRVVVLVK